MKLDSRIKNPKEIYTVVTSDTAKNYMDKQGYFTCDITDFEDLSDMGDFIFTLMSIEGGNEPFINENGDTFSYFLPLSNVSMPAYEYRPFTLAEWNEAHHIGSIITFREKTDLDEVLTLMYTGHIDANNAKNEPIIIKGAEASIIMHTKYDKESKIFLGAFCLSLNTLFEKYEIFENDGWKPFGFRQNNFKGSNA